MVQFIVYCLKLAWSAYSFLFAAEFLQNYKFVPSNTVLK